jgi:hypothetical protein
MSAPGRISPREWRHQFRQSEQLTRLLLQRVQAWAMENPSIPLDLVALGLGRALTHFMCVWLLMQPASRRKVIGRAFMKHLTEDFESDQARIEPKLRRLQKRLARSQATRQRP